MNSQTEILVVKAAMTLRGASPQGWDLFMRALALHLEDVTESCISAAPTALPERQGRAREIRELFRTLDGAPKLAEKIQMKERADAATGRKP